MLTIEEIKNRLQLAMTVCLFSGLVVMVTLLPQFKRSTCQLVEISGISKQEDD